jgi:cellulose synthase/poly-beta-1,6-N-acetylglucosamine synthase-like glycosyltransferase
MALLEISIILAIFIVSMLFFSLKHKFCLILTKVSLEPVSILIPAHNEEGTIEECVHSVISQKGVCIKKIVIVIDNSMDNTYNICKKLSKKDSRIIILKKNTIPSKPQSMLLGLNEITTSFVVMVDADTILLDSAVQKTLAMMKTENTSFGSCIIDSYENCSFSCKVFSFDKLFRQRLLQNGRAELNSSNLPGCFYIGSAKWIKKI